MSWEIVGDAHYSGNPAHCSKCAVRFWAGDTDKSDWQTSDAEITAAIAVTSGTFPAAAAICRHIAARFSRLCDRTLGAVGASSQTDNWSQKAKAYLALAKELDSRTALAASSTASAYVGGASVSEATTAAADTDLTQPSFTTGMFDAP